jgi:hypothetical protein
MSRFGNMFNVNMEEEKRLFDEKCESQDNQSKEFK